MRALLDNIRQFPADTTRIFRALSRMGRRLNSLAEEVRPPLCLFVSLSLSLYVSLSLHLSRSLPLSLPGESLFLSHTHTLFRVGRRLNSLAEEVLSLSHTHTHSLSLALSLSLSL